MQIRFEQLAAQLQKTLVPIYLLYGNEPFLIETARTAIQQTAAKAGYTERQKWHVEAGFSWSQLSAATQALSLFSQYELIEVDAPGTQLTEAAGKTLVQYCKAPAPAKILLLITDKLTPAQVKSTWYQAVAKVGTIVQVWPLTGVALQTWIRARLQAVQVKVSTEGLQLLTERAESNLLASTQEIEKLSLLFSNQTVSLAQLEEVVHDNARFDVFVLADAILEGNAPRIVRIFNSLRAEGVEPILMLWAVTRELRGLIAIAEQLAQGISLEPALQAQRVWDKRKPLVRVAVQRTALTQLHAQLRRAAELDLIIKGLKLGNVWDELLQLNLQVAGIPFLNI